MRRVRDNQAFATTLGAPARAELTTTLSMAADQRMAHRLSAIRVGP